MTSIPITINCLPIRVYHQAFLHSRNLFSQNERKSLQTCAFSDGIELFQLSRIHLRLENVIFLYLYSSNPNCSNTDYLNKTNIFISNKKHKNCFALCVCVAQIRLLLRREYLGQLIIRLSSSVMIYKCQTFEKDKFNCDCCLGDHQSSRK